MGGKFHHNIRTNNICSNNQSLRCVGYIVGVIVYMSCRCNIRHNGGGTIIVFVSYIQAKIEFVIGLV